MNTISAEQVLQSHKYNTNIPYLAQDQDGTIHGFDTKPIPSTGLSNNYWIGSGHYCFGKIAITEFQNKPWNECIYKVKPSESDMIGCIGWFWDDEEQTSVIGILHKIEPDEAFRRYVDEDYSPWKHFRPARPDEIKFFNDDTSEE